MLSKNQIKYILSLHQKKIRTRDERFIAEGTKVVGALLQSSVKAQLVVATAAWIKTYGASIPQQVELIEADVSEIKKISALSTPQEVLAVGIIPRYFFEKAYVKNNIVLALDNISDPGNLGTILRTADWFGIEHIVCSENSVDVFNQKVIQAGMGSTFHVKVHYMDLAGMLSDAICPVYGALLKGKNIYTEKFFANGIILFGNEARGISENLLPFITHPVSIPSFNNRGAESLNVAMAAAIICSEFRRNFS